MEEEAGETRVSALEGSAAVERNDCVPPNVSGAQQCQHRREPLLDQRPIHRRV